MEHEWPMSRTVADAPRAGRRTGPPSGIGRQRCAAAAGSLMSTPPQLVPISELLREHGVGLDQIVKISRTPKSTIRRLMREPTVAPARIRTETAVRLTAIQISPDQLAPRSQVDAAETRARIQELLDAGHAIPDLARALGRTPVSLRRTLTRSSVTAHTAAAVSDLFDELRPLPREMGRRETGIDCRRTGQWRARTG